MTMTVLNEFLLDADKDLNRKTNIRLPDGTFLTLDADLDEFELATQIATVAYHPSIISTEYKNGTPLRAGDTVICHFHVVREKNALTIHDKQYFRCPYFHLWAKIENQTIVPLEEFLFVEPIIEDKDKLFCGQFQVKLEQEAVHKRGRVSAIGVQAAQAGIQLNDTVIVTQNAECEITLFNHLFWRLRIRNVVGIEREGQLICMTGKVLVKEVPAPEKQSGFMLPVDESKKERIGTVLLSDIEGIAPNDTLSFHHGVDTAFLHNEEKHAYIDRENLNYIK
jgi:hypothetical protein